jgi:hypothetical protein
MILSFESYVLQLQLSIFNLFTYESTNSHRYVIHSDAMLEHEFSYKKICLFFNVHGCIHRNNILVYKSQQDAHVTEFIFV